MHLQLLFDVLEVERHVPDRHALYLCRARPSHLRVEPSNGVCLSEKPLANTAQTVRRTLGTRIRRSVLGPVAILRDKFSRSLNGSIWPEPYLKIEIIKELV